MPNPAGQNTKSRVKKTKQTVFPVGHVNFRITQSESDGTTFGLFAGGRPVAGRADYSGHVDVKMSDQLRALADHLDDIERRRKADWEMYDA